MHRVLEANDTRMMNWDSICWYEQILTAGDGHDLIYQTTYCCEQTSTKVGKAHGGTTITMKGKRRGLNLQRASDNPSIHERTTHLHMIMMERSLDPWRHQIFQPARRFRSYHSYRDEQSNKHQKMEAVEHQASSQGLTREVRGPFQSRSGVERGTCLS